MRVMKEGSVLPLDRVAEYKIVMSLHSAISLVLVTVIAWKEISVMVRDK